MARTTGSIGIKTAQAIRDQSLKLFAMHGYAAVSMRMIADAVGVQVSALYNHYPTKQALLMDLLVKHMEALLSSWSSFAANPLPPREALDRFARFHIRYHITRPDEVFLSYMELRSLDRDNFAKLDALRRRYETVLTGILEALPVDEPKVSAMAILGMLTGATTWYKPSGRLTAQELEEIYAQLALNCVGLTAKDLTRV
jgi:AcrR family transcriptional regulator